MAQTPFPLTSYTHDCSHSPYTPVRWGPSPTSFDGGGDGPREVKRFVQGNTGGERWHKDLKTKPRFLAIEKGRFMGRSLGNGEGGQGLRLPTSRPCHRIPQHQL